MIKISQYSHKSTPLSRKFTRDADVRELESLSELGDIIATYDWSPGLFKGGKRNIANFIAADLLIFDFDEGPPLEEIEPTLKDYAYVIGLTKSHRKEKLVKGAPLTCDRYRIALIPQRSITNAEDYYATYCHYLNTLFPTADNACKDPSRFYYGCTSVYAVQATGKKVPVVKAPEVTKKTVVPLSFSYKGNLTRTTLTFLESGHVAAWNPELYKASRDIKEQGYTREECTEMMTAVTKLPIQGYTGVLDEKDLKTIDSAYAKESKYAPRVVGPQNKTDEVVKIIDQNFKLQTHETGQNFYFKVNLATKELVRMDKSEGFYDLIRRLSWDLMPNLKPGLIEQILSLWRLRTEPLTEAPKAVAFSDEPVYCFRKLDFTPAPGKWDAWQDFTDRLSDSGFFMAYVWSCFEERHEGRQFAWISSPGGDGKSTILRVLKDILGNAAEAVSDSVTLSKSDFIYSSFYGKKVAIYADCKNHRFAESTLIRNITGNDYVSIQFKGKDAFSARLHLRVFVGSNIEPTFSGDRADTSRCIPLRLSPLKKAPSAIYEDALRAQVGSFLWECKRQYHLLCRDHVVIRTVEETGNLQNEAIRERYEEQAALFEKYFEASWGETLKANTVFTLLKDRERYTVWQMKDFKAYLQHYFNIRCVDRPEGRVYDGLKFRTGAFT